MAELRLELPSLPAGLRHAPTHRGYPVPHFVTWYDEEGNPSPRGEGTPDFRVVDPAVLAECWTRRLCWVCGRRITSSRVAFVSGPMCGVNRTSAEPPSHHECADFAAQACPFLARPHMTRREAGMPEDTALPGGEMITRNPGVALVWVTKKPGVRHDPRGGVVFYLGDPESVRWYACGRPATRQEVLDSIESGIPLLREVAEKDGPRALDLLDQMVEDFQPLLPAA